MMEKTNTINVACTVFRSVQAVNATFPTFTAAKPDRLSRKQLSLTFYIFSSPMFSISSTGSLFTVFNLSLFIKFFVNLFDLFFIKRLFSFSFSCLTIYFCVFLFLLFYVRPRKGDFINRLRSIFSN